MAAMAKSSLRQHIAVVLANQPNIKGLSVANEYGIPTECVNHREYATREDFEMAMIKRLDDYSPELVVLAGFMRVLTPHFIRHYQGRLINIHPSLLPAFTGLHTHRRALAAGVKIHGCTVHFVDEVLDGGAIIAQGLVPVFIHDTEDLLAARVLSIEHQLLPSVVAGFLRKDFEWQKGRVLWHKDEQYCAQHYLMSSLMPC